MIFWYLRTIQTSCDFHVERSHVVVCIETSVGCHFVTNLKQFGINTFLLESTQIVIYKYYSPSWISILGFLHSFYWPLFYWNIWIHGIVSNWHSNANTYLESPFANETVYLVLFPNFLILQFFFWYKLTSPNTHHWTKTKYSWSSRLPLWTNSCRFQRSFVWVSLYGMLNCCSPFFHLKNIFQITKTSNHLYRTWILS